MAWTQLWLTLFHTTEWYGINIGFWLGVLLIGLLVIGMNWFAWHQKAANFYGKVAK